ncbi:MAG: helix-hairpin-helix domain-containing protein [Anaerolineae bacterium]|nr:helix-hairpin-helix domain-containing protein [Anaerolineae bacterium]
MDGHDLLHALRGATEFETVGDAPTQEGPARVRGLPPDLSDCVTHVTAGNRKMPVLKGMTTTVCERDCYYCPFRAGRSAMRRVTLTPDDYARGFLALYNAGAVEGMFLSSGVVRGGVRSQDTIIDTATILREKYDYQGYMHLKIMPGAERDQVKRTMELADRVSVNLEAPNAARLEKIAPGKGFMDELLTRLQWIEDFRQSSEGRVAPSSTTEFVVGPAGESDVELLSTSQYLHRQLGLARVYFSAFRPVRDTPLENVAPTIDTRRIRLYQASFLLRDYGFDVEELPFTPEGHLPLHTDPKRAWAEEHLRHAPVEVNTASAQTLMRVPGIGTKSAQRILRARQRGRLRSLQDLRALGIVNVQRLTPYVLLDGRQPPQQQRLF